MTNCEQYNFKRIMDHYLLSKSYLRCDMGKYELRVTSYKLKV